jgi:hypothetical protein
MKIGTTSYLRSLARQLRKKPPSDFDEQFWLKFEQKFKVPVQQPPVTKIAFGRGLLARISLAVSVAAAVFTIYFMNIKNDVSTMERDAQMAMVYEDTLEDLDLLEMGELADWTDEDWDVLLNTKGDGNEG